LTLAETAEQTRHPLVIDTIAKRFGGVQALTEISLKLETTRATGIVGPNGSGKTTLFNIITGFVKPTTGSVTFDGRELTKRSRQDIVSAGIVRTFQQSMLFERASVRENLAVAGLAARLGKAELQEALELSSVLMGLDGWLDRSAAAIPFGVGRRAAIAAALMLRPRVLLLDEPAAGLTEEQVQDLQVSLRSVMDGGVGIVLVDHNMDFVAPLCERIVVMNAGLVIADGGREVLADPEVVRVYLD
jgi:ABC-type branched-subunit amino acid transport system ATPase component